MTNSPVDSPPAYETSQVGYRDQPPQAKPASDTKVNPDEQQQPQPLIPYSSAGGPSAPTPYTLLPSSNYIASPTIFHYVNPETGEHVASLLPPDHPQMVCLQQGHVPVTQFGPLGILAAIVWFPLGIGLCMLDRKVKCSRCNNYISHGVCG